MRYVVCYLCLSCSVVFVVFHLFTSGGAEVLLGGTCALGVQPYVVRVHIGAVFE